MNDKTLPDLGWSEHFARQLSESDADHSPARVAEIHRDRLVVVTPGGSFNLHPREASGAYAVGDWVLTDGTSAVRRLTPVSDLSRRAAGPGVAAQRIAANIDTIGIVTSCNEDFSVPRLERYLALVSSAGCLPLVILTKADKAEDAAGYLRQAEKLSPLVTALALNAKDPEEAARLTPWCSKAQTLALIGSSGVGKTTLRNTLTGETAETREARADDARGRHTTTFRALRPTLAGGWLIDTPGMRELQLADASEGIGAVFDDLEVLASACRFSNCGHDSEPGCAVKAAVDAGAVEPERVARWQKLLREDRYNSETLAQSRDRQKRFTKRVKGAMQKAQIKRDVER
ncbi:ribosome small subunit-dependent GTPase A [Marinovum sp.]|uniref:ribosome small subunit-dependent GTPase A n=1 Tax=Marinovum sp. TaxID=2024839 RepID=UPI002B27382E|nr:ribosome small subunit-dependent GTPase A [Marinovum sp.]